MPDAAFILFRFFFGYLFTHEALTGLSAQEDCLRVFMDHDLSVVEFWIELSSFVRFGRHSVMSFCF